jgi:hypothetical protein
MYKKQETYMDAQEGLKMFSPKSMNVFSIAMTHTTQPGYMKVYHGKGFPYTLDSGCGL